MVKEYHTDGLAGCVERRTARATGTLTAVYHASQAGIDADARWVVCCEEHGTLLESDTLSQAKKDRTDPEVWCEACREERPEPPQPWQASTGNEPPCDDHQMQCVICKRPVNVDEESKWLNPVDGGARFKKVGESCEEGGDMGWFPVGSTCYRNHKRSLEDIAIREFQLKD